MIIIVAAIVLLVTLLVTTITLLYGLRYLLYGCALNFHMIKWGLVELSSCSPILYMTMHNLVWAILHLTISRLFSNTVLKCYPYIPPLFFLIFENIKFLHFSPTVNILLLQSIFDVALWGLNNLNSVLAAQSSTIRVLTI